MAILIKAADVTRNGARMLVQAFEKSKSLGKAYGSALRATGGMDGLAFRAGVGASVGLVYGTTSNLINGDTFGNSIRTGIKYGVMGAGAGTSWHAYKNSAFRKATGGLMMSAAAAARGTRVGRNFTDALLGKESWSSQGLASRVMREFEDMSRGGSSVGRGAAGSAATHSMATTPGTGGSIYGLNTPVPSPPMTSPLDLGPRAGWDSLSAGAAAPPKAAPPKAAGRSRKRSTRNQPPGMFA